MADSMRRIRVMVRLATPLVIAPNRWLTFDGVLYAALGRRLNATGPAVLEAMRAYVAEEDGCFVASGIVWRRDYGSVAAVLAPMPVKMIRRVTADDLVQASLDRKTLNKQVNLKSGPYRNLQRSYWAWPVSSVLWRVRGDADRIAEVLDGLPGVGALVQKGFGRIVNAWVEDDDEATGHPWVTPDGAVARPVPVEVWRRRQAEFAGVRHGYMAATSRPPYWDVAGEQWCVVPPAWPLLEV